MSRHTVVWGAIVLGLGAIVWISRWPAGGIDGPAPREDASLEAGAEDLLEARRGFRTKLTGPPAPPGPAPELPPPEVFRLVHYPSPVGPLAAYVTPAPPDGQRHPAVLWAHGGFGGIGRNFWQIAPFDNDQSARAFRDAGIVLMTPSWRGENDNPGRFEGFLGEVDDMLAARDYLASLPYVDPERIYLAGHSTGGTLAWLAAEATDRFRAAFSFGGAPDVSGYGDALPFSPSNAAEVRVRSPLHFIASIRRPTYYFEGSTSGWAKAVPAMQAAASAAGAPFHAYAVAGADHFAILRPITRVLARKILEDDPKKAEFELDESSFLPLPASPTRYDREVHSANAKSCEDALGGPRVRVVDFVSDGLTLPAYYFVPRGEPSRSKRPAVIFNAAGGNLFDPPPVFWTADLAEIAPYLEAGFLVLAPTWRGQGDNPGSFVEGESGVRDSLAALAWLAAQPEVDPTRIFMAGHSSGGDITLRCAQRTDALRAVAAFMPVPDWLAWVRRVAPTATPSAQDRQMLTSYSALPGASQTRAPVFLQSAEGDATVPFADVKAFDEALRAAKRPVYARWTPGGDHYSPMIQEGVPLAVQFFRTLGKDGTPGPAFLRALAAARSP